MAAPRPLRTPHPRCAALRGALCAERRRCAERCAEPRAAVGAAPPLIHKKQAAPRSPAPPAPPATAHWLRASPEGGATGGFWGWGPILTLTPPPAEPCAPVTPIGCPPAPTCIGCYPCTDPPPRPPNPLRGSIVPSPFHRGLAPTLYGVPSDPEPSMRPHPTPKPPSMGPPPPIAPP